MDKKLLIIFPIVFVLIFFFGFYVAKKSNQNAGSTITPTPSAVVTSTPTPTTTEISELTPTPTITTTPTDLIPSVTLIKVVSEIPATGIGEGDYKFSFVLCTNSACNHYLITEAGASKFPLLATVSTDMEIPFLISSQTKGLGVETGHAYNEMIGKSEVFVGTTYEGKSGDFGDGKTYHIFSVCSAKLSTCRKYLLDTTKASATLKTLLVDSRKGKVAYIASNVTDGDSAAGTTYYYMTTGITVYFK